MKQGRELSRIVAVPQSLPVRQPNQHYELCFNIDRNEVQACVRLWSAEDRRRLIREWVKRDKKDPAPVIIGCFPNESGVFFSSGSSDITQYRTIFGYC